MTAPGFELKSQRQNVSRLSNEPPGRPAILYTLHYQSPCRDTKQNKDKRRDELGWVTAQIVALGLGSDGC